MKITFGIITLNEEDNLGRCLNSIREVADEIVIVDSGSTDGTHAIAQAHGVSWHHVPWKGYVGQKNHVLSLASNEWVFSIDADEALSGTLINEILRLKTHTVPEGISGYSMPRCVFYENRWIRHGDWYPDRLVRLFRKTRARFAGGRVHERLELDGNTCALAGDIEHHSFKNRLDHKERCQRYAQLWAEDKHAAGATSYWFSPHLHAGFRWLRNYILRGGFLDGPQGWHIAKMCAHEVFLKYGMLRKLTKETSPSPMKNGMQ
jgi:glycosyltransferase involved in cell wall biosynthesis